MPKTITVLSESKHYSGKTFSVIEQKVELPNGMQAVHSTVVHPGAVVILPKMDDGKLLLIKQYRHSIGRYLLEFPAGKLELGEDPKSSAERELSEETGFGARSWHPFGILYPLPGFCTEIQHAFCASDLYSNPLPGDADEIIELIPMAPQDFEKAIANEEVQDSKSIALYFKAKLVGLI